MITPNEPNDSSENVDVSFGQLSSQIRNVLHPHHSKFETELDTILQNYHDQMHDLFDRYPGVQDQLIDVLRQQGVTDEGIAKAVIAITLLNTLFTQSYSISQLFGVEQSFPGGRVSLGYTYWCKADNHRVTTSEITSQTVDLEPLCPKHREILTALPDSFKCKEHNHSISLAEIQAEQWDDAGHPRCPNHSTLLIAS